MVKKATEISSSQYELTQFSRCHKFYAQKTLQTRQSEHWFRHSISLTQPGYSELLEKKM